MASIERAESHMLSVVIMTRNEQSNIADCLSSLSSFAEVIVVDNGSTDDTISIVNKFANARLITSPWKGFGATRQVGVDAAIHDWILWLDADERMNDELSQEITRHLRTEDLSQVMSFPRRNFFLGQHIRGCGWSPDRVTRVFNRRYCRFNEKNVHEGIEASGPLQVTKLNQPINHYSYTSLRQYFEKNARYAELASKERCRTQRKVFAFELFTRPIWEFFRRYVLKRGFTDGLRGLVISFGCAYYVFARDAYCLLEKETPPVS